MKTLEDKYILLFNPEIIAKPNKLTQSRNLKQPQYYRDNFLFTEPVQFEDKTSYKQKIKRVRSPSVTYRYKNPSSTEIKRVSGRKNPIIY